MEERDKPSVIILTSNGPDSDYIIREILALENLLVRGVIIEDRATHYAKLIKKRIKNCRHRGIRCILGVAFSLFCSATFKALQTNYLRKNLSTRPTRQSSDHVNVIKVKSVNDQSVQVFLLENKPDFLIVYGTGLIERRIFSVCNQIPMNIHMGITPEFRGSRSEFWAMKKGELEKIGVTIHKIDEGIDTGTPIHQRFISAQEGDSEIRLRKQNIELAAEMVGELFRNNLTNQVIQNSSRRSGFFSTPTTMDTIKSIVAHLMGKASK